MTKRNDPCPCGSSKKYKKCCYQKDQEKRGARRHGLFSGSYFTSQHTSKVGLKMLKNVKVMNATKQTEDPKGLTNLFAKVQPSSKPDQQV